MKDSVTSSAGLQVTYGPCLAPKIGRCVNTMRFVNEIDAPGPSYHSIVIADISQLMRKGPASSFGRVGSHPLVSSYLQVE